MKGLRDPRKNAVREGVLFDSHAFRRQEATNRAVQITGATASSPEERRRRREEHEYGRRQEEVRGLRRARLDYDRHASMDLSVPKRAASPCSAPQRPLLVPAMVRHVPGSPPAFPSSDSAASPGEP
ncbi:unnamed protein product, partial [Ixodes persulcatus]